MRPITCAALLATLSGCTNDTQVTQPARPLAQLRPHLMYRIDILPSPGTGFDQGGAINNEGVVAGFSRQADGTRQATLWANGAAHVLGTLPGGNHSAVQWPGLTSDSTVVGISRTGTADPLGEAWSCTAFIAGAGRTCLGFVWHNGVMAPLPTLGGTNGFAAGVNSRGQIVGWAETPVHDPTCDNSTSQVLQFRAVLWSPKSGITQELPPYPGDSTSAATAINESGQVVGISGECDQAVGRKSAIRAVTWDHGTVSVLPNPWGNYWATPMAINDRGDVVGFSNPPDGDFDGDSLRAVQWTRAGGFQDLGKLPGDFSSQANGINASGQVVGLSCSAVCTALLWQDGVMYKLQDFVDPAFPHRLWSARHINDQGQITGRLVEAGTGRRLAYIATPIVAP